MSVKEPTWLVDLSKHQGPRVDFAGIEAEGYSGVISKMSEGTGYIDPCGTLNLAKTLRQGLWAGAYHFLWGGMSATRQANHFLQQVSLVAAPVDVALFVDVERSDTMKPAQYPTFSHVRVFLKRLETVLPEARLGIYSGYYWRDHLGNVAISDLGLKEKPIIWDSHYFTTEIDWASNLYVNVPYGYWKVPAFGGEVADILQFASTGRLRQFPDGIDVNACPRGLANLGSEAEEDDDMSEWHPGHGDSLVPPGFRAEKPILKSAIYQERHPTRYRWHTHVQPLIRALYKEFGGPKEIHINTYLDHPEGYHRTLDSFDVWGPGGRNDPLHVNVGEEVRRFCFEWDGLPDIDWCIYRRKIYSAVNNYEPKPFGEDAFTFHDDHYHQTSTRR